MTDDVVRRNLHLFPAPEGRREDQRRLEARVEELTAQLGAAETKLARDALHDALTGLPNRALFMDRLGRAVERTKHHPDYAFATLILDLDRFKLVNDGLGPALGDQLLRGIALRLLASRRPQDTVARLGGDEFGILLEEIEDERDATRVVGRILEDLQQPLALGERDVFSTASIGVAVSSTGYQHAEEVLRDAETAMHRAKARGPSSYQVFDPTMHLRAVALLQLEMDLRRALERGEFAVCYQPVVSLGSGRLAGFEALARWRHPSRGLVAPEEFITVAEDTGLIVPLGSWVLREACRQLVAWREKYGADAVPPMSVNLSGRQLLQGDLVEHIREVLQETGAPGRLLRLEITESVITQNAEQAARTLARLRELELQVSVDDFGTGYSSLSLLHAFPIDTLKIDRSFVNRLGDTAEGGQMVQTIIALARNLGLDVVAEGVETEAQLSSLQALGCGYGQGFLFHRPLDVDEAEELISQPRRLPGAGAGAC